jgi:hypothetical protein
MAVFVWIKLISNTIIGHFLCDSDAFIQGDSHYMGPRFEPWLREYLS